MNISLRMRYIILFLFICADRGFNFRARIHFEPYEKLPYDYLSVMHYRALAFSKDHISATIVPKDSRTFFAIGQRKGLSSLDIAKLNVLYNCGPGYYTGGFKKDREEHKETASNNL